jgi:geranylgeranyl diphosphate synthase, type I
MLVSRSMFLVHRGGMVAQRSIDLLMNDTETLMRRVVDDAEQLAGEAFHSDDLSLYGVIRYHLGWVDEHFSPMNADGGKRMRPMICLLSTGAADGDPGQAIPVAAAMEFLHNFTLMHDDIQDRSELRRGRPTVWRRWGEAQAINAGDATFAISQLALLRADHGTLPAETVLEIMNEFNRMTLQIVEGQVLDLGFEQRWNVSQDDYLRMISGKTAAIVRFATWAGSRIAGCSETTSDQFSEFGQLLGLGFQIRDDFLGIWGDDSTTGKKSGDDIRGRKRSIPIIMLLDSVSERQRAELQRIYEQDEILPEHVETITEMLDEHGIAERVQALTERYHDRATTLIAENATPGPFRESLLSLAAGLVDRSR